MTIKNMILTGDPMCISTQPFHVIQQEQRGQKKLTLLYCHPRVQDGARQYHLKIIAIFFKKQQKTLFLMFIIFFRHK